MPCVRACARAIACVQLLAQSCVILDVDTPQPIRLRPNDQPQSCTHARTHARTHAHALTVHHVELENLSFAEQRARKDEVNCSSQCRHCEEDRHGAHLCACLVSDRVQQCKIHVGKRVRGAERKGLSNFSKRIK